MTNGTNGSNGQSPMCERLLSKLTSSADGTVRKIVRLRGTGVPTDAEMYLCRKTFVTLQVRVKTLDHPDETVLHEYALDPDSINAGKGGVHELQCSRSKHNLQVKLQPALGLEDLLPPYMEEPIPELLTALLEKDLWSFMAVYHLLTTFVADPTRKSVPLVAGYGDSTKNIEWLLDDMNMLNKLLDKCPMFSRSYGSPPALNLLDPERPKTRGLLNKALLEVKYLIIRAITQIREFGERLLDAKEYGDFQAYMMHVYEGCAKGGVDAQYDNEVESMKALRYLLCGGVKPPPPPAEPVVEKKAPAKAEPPPVAVAAVTSAAPAPADAQLRIEVPVPFSDAVPISRPRQPELNGTEPLGQLKVERFKLGRLQIKLTDALKHLQATGGSVGEANSLSDNAFMSERSSLTFLTAMLTKRLEESDKRQRELDIAIGNGGAEKRQRTE